MNKIAIIGAGISGLTVAQLLKNKYEVRLFEKGLKAGGLIRCEHIQGNLFHTCGGHVFNSKNKDVLNWFWSFFNREREFVKAERNSIVFMQNGLQIPYPIENHVYLFDAETQRKSINDWLSIKQSKDNVHNFEEFLRGRFGETLYQQYFKPYNEKVWRRDLTKVPLTWLEGKLPMPTVEEMIFNNMNHVEEKAFVHSSFWYAKENGSQFIVDRLAEGLNIVCSSDIQQVVYNKGKWMVSGEVFDKVIFCGNIKQLPSFIKGVDINNYTNRINAFESHGTTAVFCEIKQNPYSWIYQPSTLHESHRIICTGNFSPTNNATGRMTGTIEFTDEISKKDILENLSRIPLSPKYLKHHYNKYTYPIQDSDTREMINSLKDELSTKGFFMTGRFADWEYYNMDVAIDAAMTVVKRYSI
jgi:protoporphyrinogen oxidase